MPQKAWSERRERQYEHIKDSYIDRGVGDDEAEERAESHGGEGPDGRGGGQNRRETGSSLMEKTITIYGNLTSPRKLTGAFPTRGHSDRRPRKGPGPGPA